MGSSEITQTKQNKKGELDYTDEALALLNLLMNLWKALMSALDPQFKPSKKPLLTEASILNLLRVGQLQKRSSNVLKCSSSGWDLVPSVNYNP